MRDSENCFFFLLSPRCTIILCIYYDSPRADYAARILRGRRSSTTTIPVRCRRLSATRRSGHCCRKSTRPGCAPRTRKPRTPRRCSLFPISLGHLRKRKLVHHHRQYCFPVDILHRRATEFFKKTKLHGPYCCTNIVYVRPRILETISEKTFRRV